ncbi:hypothetical protein ABZ725_07985 [Streptomyces sp. NPDC006872]|uniref:hypothetical protein n=1 Tax=Streptomyces sp. NPDC006872 TaxID=3155720 RepID=UPI0033D7BB41
MEKKEPAELLRCRRELSRPDSKLELLSSGFPVERLQATWADLVRRVVRADGA